MILIPLWLLVVAATTVQSFSVSSSSTRMTITIQPWKFQGHDVFCQVNKPMSSSNSKNKPAILLIHGFGCSTTYWRETVASLVKAGYSVHAIDLLGQGFSDKPTSNIYYSTGLWAQEVDAYARENLSSDSNIVLLGNSVGSLVALAAATGDFGQDDEWSETSEQPFIRQRVAGVGMFNCGIGLNVRNIVKDPKWNAIQRYLLNVIFDVLESLIFGNVALVTWFLDNVVTRDVLRDVLLDLYTCADDPSQKVDDDLVDSFYIPAKQAGSPQVLCQILTNDAGPTPMELHAKHDAFLQNLPIHLVWGDEDTVTPLRWQVGQFYSDLAEQDKNPVSLEVIHGGHIPFDEVPEVANDSMLKWLNEVVTVK